MRLCNSTLLVLAVVLLGLFILASSVHPLDRRIAVVENKMPGMTGYLAFSTVAHTGKLLVSESPDGDTWSAWRHVHNSVPLTSNPVACLDNTTKSAWAFGQGMDGQVYLFSQSSGNHFTETKLSTDLPVNLQPSQFSLDPVKCIVLKNVVHLFARSQSGDSKVYWTYSNGYGPSPWNSWQYIGSGSDYLKYDPLVVISNYYFIERLEVFVVSTNGFVLYTWQESETTFADKWVTIGDSLSPKKFNSVPVARPMNYYFENDILTLIVRGEDYDLYCTSEGPCSKLQNPWGPCYWGSPLNMERVAPSSKSSLNPLTISRNANLGAELFTVGANDSHLYRMLRFGTSDVWSTWEDLGPLSSTSGFYTQPDVIVGPEGWWQAFAENSTGGVMHFVQTPLSFALSATSVAFDHNITVSWDIPTDEGTNRDWIGIYPSGAPNNFYVDYSYVGGSQRPPVDPVPKGALNFTSFLPNGIYDYRYMANDQYVAVLQASATTYNSTTALEWAQLYEGIARRLGNLSTNIIACVDDGNATVETFRASFTAIENRKIYLGLHLFAEGLQDFRDTLERCGETKIIEPLTKFIEALFACTESDCTNFVINVGVRITIYYRAAYMMYGDILGATNCFKIDAYEQGGVSIGRVTNACVMITPP